MYTYSYHSDADVEDLAHRHRSMLTNATLVHDDDYAQTQTVASNNATHDGFTKNMDDDTGTGGARNETIDHPSSFPGSTNLTKNTFQQQTSSSTSSTTTTANVHKISLEEEEEYMIVSGGFTDHDWKTFPVYAFPITSAIHTSSGQWIDLTPSASKYDDIDTTSCHDLVGEAALAKLSQEAKFIDETTSTNNNSNSTEEKSEEVDPWKYASPCAPFGRMGHISAIHEDKLYVFGGLIYAEEDQLMPSGSGGGGGGHFYGKRTMFQLENIPHVYRLDLKEMLDARRAESEGDMDLLTKKKITGWQRIIPRVKKSPTTNNGKSSSSLSLSAADVLLTLVNRGEMQGGIWSSESSGGHDKLVMHGGLRIEKVDYDNYGLPSRTSSQMVELPLADIWAYDLVLDCWEKITNTYGKVS